MPPTAFADAGPRAGQPLPRAELWRASVKVPMYTVAATPILAGSAAAFADARALHPPTLAAFLLAAVFIIAWLNCSNDVFDFDTGVDVNKPESIVNLCGASARARNAVLLAANALLLCAFAALYALSVAPVFDPTVPAILAVAVFGGYAYQGPPFRLSYVGAGEPICFSTWFISVAAAYYSQLRLAPAASSLLAPSTPSWKHQLRASISLLVALLKHPTSSALFAACFLVALPTAIILFCSHFHQIHDDRAAGKKSPIVRLGTQRAARVLRFALVLLYSVQLILCLTGGLHAVPALLAFCTIPNALELDRFVSLYHAKPERVRVAKYYAVKLHFLHGMALTVGWFLVGFLSTSDVSRLS